MSALHPTPQPGDPLRRVVGRCEREAANVDRLECGHTVVDFGRSSPARRRCRACGRLPRGCPECGARAGAPCVVARRAHLAELAAEPCASRVLGAG